MFKNNLADSSCVTLVPNFVSGGHSHDVPSYNESDTSTTAAYNEAAHGHSHGDHGHSHGGHGHSHGGHGHSHG